jgi:hypothetical protein
MKDAFKTSSPLLNRSDTDVIESKAGGGCVSLFGLPFFLAGLFIAQIPLGIIPVDANKDTTTVILTALIGGVFTIVGLFLILGRGGLKIDRRSGTVLKWSGLLAPMKRREYNFGLFRQVSLKRREGEKNAPDTYPVNLEGMDGQARIEILIASPSDYSEARRTAEELAEFMRKPLEDSTTGERVVREAGRLNESFRDRARRTGEFVGGLPPMPMAMKTKVEQTLDGVVLDIPATTSVLFRYLPVVFALGFVAVVVNFILREGIELPMQPMVRYGMILIIAVFFILLPLVSALSHLRKTAWSHTRVTATRSVLRVEEIVGGRTKTAEIPAGELEELRVPTKRSVLQGLDTPGQQDPNAASAMGDTGAPRLPDGRPAPRFMLALLRFAGSPGITASSDKTSVSFGQGLPEEEAVYLHALIRNAILK